MNPDIPQHAGHQPGSDLSPGLVFDSASEARDFFSKSICAEYHQCAGFIRHSNQDDLHGAVAASDEKLTVDGCDHVILHTTKAMDKREDWSILNGFTRQQESLNEVRTHLCRRLRKLS